MSCAYEQRTTRPRKRAEEEVPPLDVIPTRRYVLVLADTGELFDGYNSEMRAVHRRNGGRHRQADEFARKVGWRGSHEPSEPWIVRLDHR